jgi:hypothetical protein
MNARMITLAAMIAAVGRLLITPRLASVPSIEGAYEALAHLFVGALIGICLYDWRERLGHARLYGLMAILLTVLEAVMFVIQKMGA